MRRGPPVNWRGESLEEDGSEACDVDAAVAHWDTLENGTFGWIPDPRVLIREVLIEEKEWTSASSNLGELEHFLEMTHMRWAHGQSGHESTDYTLSVVPHVGGWEAWPIDKCFNKDVGKR